VEGDRREEERRGEERRVESRSIRVRYERSAVTVRWRRRSG
jgi:hypothetical protein